MGSYDDDDPTATIYVGEDLDEQDDYESEQEHHTLQNQYDVDVVGDEDDEEEEEDDSTSSAAGDFTIAVSGTPNVTTTVTPTTTTTTSIVRSDAIIEAKKPALDDSRRLFQRLWTDEDEIELLQGFLDYTIQRGTNNSSQSHHYDTTAYYDQIKGKLQLDFNKNQLVEKLRRLKKKYRNVLSKINSGKECVFKSLHDQATFNLSCKIWGETAATTASIPADSGGNEYEEHLNPTSNLNDHNGNEIADPNYSEKKVPKSRKRSRPSEVKFDENYNQQQQYSKNSTSVTPNVVEETVKTSLLPLFKELVNNLANGPCGNSRGLGLGLGLMSMNPFGGSMNFQIGDMTDDKWRKQQILELEVYSKRLELMQDQVKSRLEELRSVGN